MSIDILPDEALLEIFSFHLEEAKHIEPWIPLVHVCRRWRSIVFTSPCRLNLRVYLIPRKRQVKVMLDIWPNLPIHILALGYPTPLCNSENNLLAALGLTDRICRIQMDGSRSDLERILPAMQRPFPALTGINIKCLDYIHRRTITVLPEAFLGGSAQHLRSCDLWAVEFPGIWKLLSTSNHLVTLNLWYIPHSMSAPPERMATHLSTMPNLESLSIVFRPPQSLRSWPDQPIRRHLSPLTRVVLPSLTKFWFQAMGWYIEDFVSRIDVPLLNKVGITFFDQPAFNTPQLHGFFGRIERFKAHSQGSVVFGGSSIEFELKPGSFSCELAILCEGIGRQISSMVQLCGSSLHVPSTLKRLDVCKSQIGPVLYEVETPQWLDLFHPFAGLEDLHIGRGLVLHYALALRELAGERVTEVLPALQNLFIEGLEPSGPIQEALGRFVAARQLSGLPVTVHSWDGQS